MKTWLKLSVRSNIIWRFWNLLLLVCQVELRCLGLYSRWSIHPSLCLCLSVRVYVSVCVSFSTIQHHLSILESSVVHVSVYMSGCRCVCQSDYKPPWSSRNWKCMVLYWQQIYQCVCQGVCLSVTVCLSVCDSVFVCLSFCQLDSTPPDLTFETFSRLCIWNKSRMLCSWLLI